MGGAGRVAAQLRGQLRLAWSMIYEIEGNIAHGDTVTTCQVIWAIDFCMIDLNAITAL
jgi:hypothetical protein